MIVGLVSSFREGRLVRGAVESLARGCDLVLVLEGPAPRDREPLGDRSQLGKLPPNVIVREQGGDDDADKRTKLVRWAQAVHKNRAARSDGLWLVWCDADELLLWCEYLPDYIVQLERSGADKNGTGGFGLRHVEPDGSVHLSTGRVLNGLEVSRYLQSGYQIELRSGVTIAAPLLPLCTAGGIPLAPAEGIPRSDEERDRWLAQHRPPLHGEPHTLHRHPLRVAARSAQRMHDDEAAWFERTVGA